MTTTTEQLDDRHSPDAWTIARLPSRFERELATRRMSMRGDLWRLLLLVLGMAFLLAGIFGCKASPQVVALQSLRVTVQTVDAAVKEYGKLAPMLIADAVKQAAVECVKAADVQGCRAAAEAPRFRQLRNADAALSVLVGIERAGASAAQPTPDWAAAVAAVVTALEPLGIFVEGGK